MEQCTMDAESQLEERINQIVEDISRVQNGRLDACVAVSEGELTCMLNSSKMRIQCSAPRIFMLKSPIPLLL